MPNDLLAEATRLAETLQGVNASGECDIWDALDRDKGTYFETAKGFAQWIEPGADLACAIEDALRSNDSDWTEGWYALIHEGRWKACGPFSRAKWAIECLCK